jgi:hypothetical protein
MNKIEESQTSFSNSVQEQLKTLKESNEQQNNAVRKALSEQYELLRTSIEGQGATFKTKLDELNKDVYDMKSRIGQPATTTVVSQPIGPNAMVPQQPIMVESTQPAMPQSTQQTGMAGPTSQQNITSSSYQQPVLSDTGLLNSDKRYDIIKEMLVSKYLIDLPSGTNTKSKDELINDNDLIKKLWSGLSDDDKYASLRMKSSELMNALEKYNYALNNKPKN